MLNYTLEPRRLPLILALLVALPAASARGQALTPKPALSVATRVEESMMPTEDVDANQSDLSSPVEVVEERDPKGKLRVRREVIQDDFGNYVLHGKWEMWDEAGKKIAFGTYRQNERHGTWTRVHAAKDAKLFSQMPFKEYSGPFVSEATFQDGKLDGKWVIHDNQRRKICEWSYANGLRHGVSAWTYASGHLMKEILYQEGRIDGQLRVWDENKKLVVDERYQDGRKLAFKVEHDEKGVKTGEGMCLEPPLVMDQPDDWWNARPARFSATGNVAKHGRWISWHPNGEKRSDGVYEHDLPEGEFVWWFANRQKRLVGSFQSGKPQGPWIWWHENGQKASKGEYTDGEPTGAWAYWNKDGKLYQKHEFSLSTHAIVDQPHGPQPADRSAAQTLQETRTETVDR